MNIRIIATVGALGLALAGCGGGNNGSVTLTPQPPTNPGTQPVGPFTQIERLSRPAIKEVFQPFVEHQVSNGLEPYDPSDPLMGRIQTTEDALRKPVTGGPDYGKTLQAILFPDKYAVNLSQTTGGFLGVETNGAAGGAFGGRNINDDVIGIELGVLFGNTLSKLGVVADDGLENNCISAQNVTILPTQQSTNSFPYLNNPL